MIELYRWDQESNVLQSPTLSIDTCPKLSEIDAIILREEQLEKDIQITYTWNNIVSLPRMKHDSIPRLLELSEAIITLSRWEAIDINSRVNRLVNLDFASIKWSINDFLSNNRQPVYRNLLNRSWKVLESILWIQNTQDTCNWVHIFLKLENFTRKKAA